MIPPGCCPVVRRTPTHPCTIRSISQFLLCSATLFIIIFHITKRRLICQRTDRSGTESLSFTKNNLRIFMCLSLILPGEVQVDIRLFVSLKSQESLKRNIKPLFSSDAFSAHRAYLIRHVTTGTAGICFHFVGIKIHNNDTPHSR